MPVRPADEKIRAALTKLGATLAEPSATTDDPLHPNLRMVVDANYKQVGPFKFKGRDPEVWGLELFNGGVTEAKRPYATLGHYDGGNYTVLVFDYGAEDPAVYACDHEDMDEDGKVSNTRRLAAKLSSFVGKLKSEREKPSKSKKLATLELRAQLSLPGGKPGVSPPLIAARPDGSFVAERSDSLAYARRTETGWDMVELPRERYCRDLVIDPRPGVERFANVDFNGVTVFERDSPEAPFVAHELPVPEGFEAFDIRAEPSIYPSCATFVGELLAVGMNGTYSVCLYARGEQGYELRERFDGASLGLDDKGFGQLLASNGEELAIVGFNNAVHVLHMDTRELVTLRPKTLEGRPIDKVESLAMSDRYLLFGVPQDFPKATGLDDKPGKTSAPQVGAAYLYERDETGAWSYLRCIKPKRAAQHRRFGACVGVCGERFVVCTAGSTNAETVTTVVQRGERGGLRYLSLLAARKHGGYDKHAGTAITATDVLEYHREDGEIRVWKLV